MFKISIDKLDALYNAIAATKELYIPVRKAGQVDFASYEEGAEVAIDALKTVKSPKNAFFPQFETLYSVNKTIIPADASAEEGACEGAGIALRSKLSVEMEALVDKDFVVFGIKPCDVKGVEVLDNVFLSEPVDSFYKARRDHGILVSMACNEPEESCFCSVFGIDPADPSKAKADVAVWLSDGNLYWKAITEKGEALTESVSSLLENADDSAVDSTKASIANIIEKLPNTNLSLEKFGAGKLKDRFDSPVWNELFKPCLACGTCTFVCPTCQCYDIKDYTTKNGIQRYRCWDSCMYSDFTMMAHGNNRNSQMQRFRQRFMHKLVYYPDNNDGMFACVGCGRCVDKCPQSLNIVKVIKAFNEEKEVQA